MSSWRLVLFSILSLHQHSVAEQLIPGAHTRLAVNILVVKLQGTLPDTGDGNDLLDRLSGEIVQAK